jgi:hypothetical protein
MGLTRARLTQILDLTLLSPDLQERVLGLEAPGGEGLPSERSLRMAVRAAEWSKQPDLVTLSGSMS